MPTTKIADLPPECEHPDHAPQKRRLGPGVYVHLCPACGATEHFEIPNTATARAMGQRGGN